ncbi:hypothetical protein Daus18300_010143 [Diaporthe australafricana]|uniref:Uncharacterized protein n=1 Tax=Diaporthe australafricana TaxID=127596 RepID=A0ABR3WBJ8_9PEZI
MQLKTGIYFISTIATSPWGERWVQRSTAEDKTLLPKPVSVQLEEGAAEWIVEQMDDTTFALAAGAIDVDPTGTIGQDGKLFADPSGRRGQNWTVTECETCEEGVFMWVSLSTPSTGQSAADLLRSITDDNAMTWQTAKSADDDTQILIDDLIITMIYPPKYPAYAQFKFAAADDVDME